MDRPIILLPDPPQLIENRSWRLLVGGAEDRLRELPPESVHTIVTSPPYYSVRAYADQDGSQLGHEDTPEEFVSNLCDILDVAGECLRDDGTLWLNIGDTYAGSGGAGGDHQKGGSRAKVTRYEGSRARMGETSYKDKDLIGIPWMVAFEMRRRGWWLRQNIVWHKLNPKPDGAKDRPTTTHEFVFLLTKSKSYYYDHVASMEPGKTGNPRNKRTVWTTNTSTYKGAHFATFPPDLIRPMIASSTSPAGACPVCGAPLERLIHRRGKSVYKQMLDEHGIDAAQLREMAEERGESVDGRVGGTRNPNGKTPTLDGPPFVTVGWQAGCEHEEAIHSPTPCTVLDPFSGAATTALVAIQAGCQFVGTEASQTYAEMAEQRLQEQLGVLSLGSVE